MTTDDNFHFDGSAEEQIDIDLDAAFTDSETVENEADEISVDFSALEADDSAERDFEQIDFSALDEHVDDESDQPVVNDGGEAQLEAALAELRAELRSKPGEWFVVHTYSGMENRVKQNIDARVVTLNMEDYIFETLVPTEDAVEIRNGQKKTVTRTYMPGYVLVRMDLTDESWQAVRHTASVTGFVGHANQPVPLGLDEVERMLTPSIQAKLANVDQVPAAKRRKKVEVVDYAVGDSVQVADGPFTGVHATITEINPHSQRVKAMVEILGRETPVDLTFAQIQKIV